MVFRAIITFGSLTIIRMNNLEHASRAMAAGGRRNGLLTVGFASAAHAYAHLVVLLFATVVLVLEDEWAMSYA